MANRTSKATLPREQQPPSGACKPQKGRQRKRVASSLRSPSTVHRSPFSTLHSPLFCLTLAPRGAGRWGAVWKMKETLVRLKLALQMAKRLRYQTVFAQNIDIQTGRRIAYLRW